MPKKNKLSAPISIRLTPGNYTFVLNQKEELKKATNNLLNPSLSSVMNILINITRTHHYREHPEDDPMNQTQKNDK